MSYVDAVLQKGETVLHRGELHWVSYGRGLLLLLLAAGVVLLLPVPARWQTAANWLAILLAVLSVQAGAAVAKGIFPAVGATGAAGLRIGLAAVLLLAVWALHARHFKHGLPEQSVLPLTVLGVLAVTFAGRAAVPAAGAVCALAVVVGVLLHRGDGTGEAAEPAGA